MLKRINKKQILKDIFSIIIILLMFVMCFDIITHTEKYSDGMKYQLENKIKAENQEAIEYYNNNYLSKGVQLFDIEK